MRVRLNKGHLSAIRERINQYTHLIQQDSDEKAEALSKQEEKIKAYRALPWYKKLLTAKPEKHEDPRFIYDEKYLFNYGLIENIKRIELYTQRVQALTLLANILNRFGETEITEKEYEMIWGGTDE